MTRKHKYELLIELNMKVKNLFLLGLGIVFILSTIVINNEDLTIDARSTNKSAVDNQNMKISAISEKIYINDNWSDAKLAGICTGNGTDTNPYIIEDLIIDGGGLGTCILIENSTDYFKIENCSVSNCGSNTYDAGIKLISVNNGNLTNNVCTSPNAYGMILDSSLNNIVALNKFIGKNGLRFFASNSNVIYLNDNSQTNLIGFEYRLSSNNRFHTQKKMEYIFNNKTHKNYLGNRWGGYQEADNNNDGIGDTPHAIDKHLPSAQWVYIDYYPLYATIENYIIIGEASSETIPSYNLYFIIGAISITTIVLLRKLKQLKK